MSAFVVVNPLPAVQAANGAPWRGRFRRSTLTCRSPSRGDAATRPRWYLNALREGHHEIVAVGGDGTINEAVNGFFDRGGAISPDAVLAFVCCGSGGDFKKAFGIAESGVQAAERLNHASVRAIDVGRVSFRVQERHGAQPHVREHRLVRSVGQHIVDSVNRAVVSKLFGGPFAFAFHSALGLLTYRGRMVRLIVDDAYDEIVTISTVAVANGCCFGGGMQVAPEAKPDDGLFDVTIIADAPKRQMLADMKLIYTGEHLGNPNVRVIRGRKVVAAPVAETRGRAVLIETDGEGVGRLPATFEILPRALNVRC